MTKSKKVVVTGGAGFLGSHVADALTVKGYDVTIFDTHESKFINEKQKMVIGDILDHKQIEKAVKGCQYVFHFAGLADINESKEKPVETVKNNILGTTYILEACKKYHNILLRFATETNWKVEFVIYSNLSINNNGKIDLNKSNLLKRYFLKNNKHKSKKFTKLICHLDFNLFYGLLKRKFDWNQPMAGSSILYERKPNKFDPNLVYSLNFLGI